MGPAELEAPLFSRLAELGIETRTLRHRPVRTVAEAKEVRGDIAGAQIKNLLLRDKKKRLWLLTALEDRVLNLKALRPVLGARRGLTFASAEIMVETLGVKPGAVTPFAVLNDTAGRVTMVLDRGILKHDIVNAHPLHNAATTAIAVPDLLLFLEACDHTPVLLDL